MQKIKTAKSLMDEACILRKGGFFKMKNQIKGKNGITLIALVISIIVLLILAGVTIATLTGDSGLLTKSGEARKSNIVGTEKEKIGLGFNEYRIKKYTNTNPALIVEGATVTENGTDGWTIKFAENEYTLSADGKTIEGPITEGNISAPITFYLDGYECHSNAGVSWEEFFTGWDLPDGWYFEDGFLYTGEETKGFPVYIDIYGVGPVDGEEYCPVY